jgi:hypothetical protein
MSDTRTYSPFFWCSIKLYFLEEILVPHNWEGNCSWWVKAAVNFCHSETGQGTLCLSLVVAEVPPPQSSWKKSHYPFFHILPKVQVMWEPSVPQFRGAETEYINQSWYEQKREYNVTDMWKQMVFSLIFCWWKVICCCMKDGSSFTWMKLSAALSGAWPQY